MATQREKLAAQLAQVLGKTLEEALELIPEEKLKDHSTRVLESHEEVMFEAQSVLNYYEKVGSGFRHTTCKTCNRKFAYSYHYKGIKQCSIECMNQALQAIGLQWTPNRPLEQRWGLTAVPAVVPAAVIALKPLESVPVIKNQQKNGRDPAILSDLDEFLSSI